MKGVATHGVFLGVVLFLAYQAWTPNETRSTNLNRDGEISVWELAGGTLQSFTYQGERRTTTVDQRRDGDLSYLWGVSVESSASDSFTRREEFPLGDEGEDVWERLSHLRALRDLGELNDSTKETYALTAANRRLTVTHEGGQEVLAIGGTVYGGSHRYALDAESNRGFVLADELLRALEGGSSSLRRRTLHEFGQDEIGSVTVSTPSGERSMSVRRGATRNEDTWFGSDTPDEPDQTFKNFIDHVRQLAFTTYESNVNVDTLEFLVRIDYEDDEGNALGFLDLHRASGSEPDLFEYFLTTSATRIPAHAHRSLAERVERDLADLF